VSYFVQGVPIEACLLIKIGEILTIFYLSGKMAGVKNGT